MANLCDRKPDIFPDTLKEIVADKIGKDNKAGYKVKNEWKLLTVYRNAELEKTNKQSFV